MNYGYLRLSTDESNQANSFDVQTEYITERYTIDKFFKDTTSGSVTLDKRPSWIELMSLVTKGDNIIVHRLDRLSRNSLDFLTWEHKLNSMGIHLIYIEGQNGNDAMSKMVRTILVAVAELERSMIANRIKQSKRVLKQQGKHLGGSIPFGFNKDDNGYLKDNKQEQSIIAVMREAREDKQLSYNKIAGYLNDLGYTTRNGGVFTSTGVSRALNYKGGINE